MFRNIGLPELIIFLIIIILLFGIGRVSKIMGEMGSGIRSFKEGLAGKNQADKKQEEKENDLSDDDVPDPS
jgi:sec-independent protein translocase protein TatA